MEARQLIGGSAHSPETLKVVFKAFDQAWDEIAPQFGERAVAIQAARMKLASIVLEVVSKGNRDPELIKASALKIFALSREAAKG